MFDVDNIHTSFLFTEHFNNSFYIKLSPKTRRVKFNSNLIPTKTNISKIFIYFSFRFYIYIVWTVKSVFSPSAMFYKLRFISLEKSFRICITLNIFDLVSATLLICLAYTLLQLKSAFYQTVGQSLS